MPAWIILDADILEEKSLLQECGLPEEGEDEESYEEGMTNDEISAVNDE